MDFCYGLTKGILRAYNAFCVKGYEVQGLENLISGPKIIVANHPNATDSFFLPFIIPEKLHFFIEESIFRLPFFGSLLKSSDQIPVGFNLGRDAIDEALKKLSQGNVVVIFPEGRLNHGKSIQRGRIGPAMLAMESGVPIIPVGFFVPEQFTRRIEKKRNGNLHSGLWQIGGRCYIQIGEPWMIDPLIHWERKYRFLREITDEMMVRIQKLVWKAESSVPKSLINQTNF
jgi:1-acyl-sn-glycerol-3-phosphate acyltransferase